MKAEFKRMPLSKAEGGLVCLFLMHEEKLPRELSSLTGDFRKHHSDMKEGDTFATCTLGKAQFRHLLVVDLGKRKEFRSDNLRKAAGAALRHAEMLRQKEFQIVVPDVPGMDGDKVAQAMTEGALLSGFRFLEFKTKKEGLFQVEKVVLTNPRDLSQGVRLGTIYADAQNYSRQLDERPANFATPTMIAKEARRLAKQKRLSVTVYDKKALERMGMGGILGVASGSAEPPVMVRLEYNKGKRLPLYCLVGKGITFDSGGISLKPSKDMHQMKYDKTGAIDMLGIMKAVAELQLPIRLIALLPFAENVPSGSAQKPGDIITTYSGKTVEVLNTDAEGRMILADALSYAAQLKPEAIIDLATLTGAMVVALGKHAIGLFSNDDKLAEVLERAGMETHERVWRLPVWQEYSEMMKSDLADLKNISELPEAGSITAAAFLKEFVGESRWAHLDIAAVDHVNSGHPYIRKGAAGISVRLVTEALSMLSNKK